MNRLDWTRRIHRFPVIMDNATTANATAWILTCKWQWNMALTELMAWDAGYSSGLEPSRPDVRDLMEMTVDTDGYNTTCGSGPFQWMWQVPADVKRAKVDQLYTLYVVARKTGGALPAMANPGMGGSLRIPLKYITLVDDATIHVKNLGPMGVSNGTGLRDMDLTRMDHATLRRYNGGGFEMYFIEADAPMDFSAWVDNLEFESMPDHSYRLPDDGSVEGPECSERRTGPQAEQHDRRME